ncbi:MAG: hypothetical protein ACLP50_09280 [Solirubrobacteraceae bacterium]
MRRCWGAIKGAFAARAALGLAVALSLVAATTVALSVSRTRAATPYGIALADPPYFVATSQSGIHTTLQLRSPATDQVIATLKTFGSSFTDNGLALSPNGRDVYFTLIPKTSGRHPFNLLLERLSIRTRRQTLIAKGEVPAVSPDSRLLAYVTGATSRSVAVRDTATGSTRSIDLTRLLGTQSDVFNGSVAWLANGRGLALVASTTSPVAVARDTSRATRTDHGTGVCAPQRAPECLVIVHLAAHGRLLATPYPPPRSIFLVNAISPDASAPGSVLIGWVGRHDQAIIDRITPHGTTLSTQRLAIIHAGLAMSFDATGSRLLYLVGHSPPALWIADLTQAGLTHAERLIPDSQIGAAW